MSDTLGFGGHIARLFFNNIKPGLNHAKRISTYFDKSTNQEPCF